MEVLQPLTRMAHGKTIQKEKGAYKFFPTNGSLLTTQFLKGDSVMVVDRKIEDTKRAIAEAEQCKDELLRAFMVSELNLRLASLEKAIT